MNTTSKSSKIDIPTVAEIGEREILIRITGGVFDDLGRIQFVAFWRETDRVRGQVFFANVERFIARERDGEHTFRIIA